jgi:hypothetical protein
MPDKPLWLDGHLLLDDSSTFQIGEEPEILLPLGYKALQHEQ